MSDNAERTALLQDKYKTNLGALDIFDRVINLKLTVSYKDTNGNLVEGEQYVIRSDYETYYPELMNSVATDDWSGFTSLKKCYIRKCQHKPSIKVQYKRVSMDVPVDVDIFINNFFMLDKSGQMLKAFNNSTYKLTKVELAMGYFGQFDSMLRGNKVSAISVSDLFDFDEDKLSGHGITLITLCDVPYVQTDKLPPDMTVHIHGFAGNLYAETLESLSAKKNTPKAYDKIKKSNRFISYSSLGDDTIIEKTFFEAVTRNWVREGSLPKSTTIKLTNSTNFTVDGVLSKADADKYGVKVYLSNKAKAYAKQYDKDHVTVGSDGTIHYPEALKLPKCATAMQKVNAIIAQYMTSSYCTQPIATNGCILVYHKDEIKAPSDMLSGTALEKYYKNTALDKYWEKKLPAVYNITNDSLCTIVCPFFFFVNPFQQFKFKSRYALGGLVSYFANFNASQEDFYALWQTVSFATVENVNESTIVCISMKGES